MDQRNTYARDEHKPGAKVLEPKNEDVVPSQRNSASPTGPKFRRTAAETEREAEDSGTLLQSKCPKS